MAGAVTKGEGMTDTVLFDLDGTLLSMDQDLFVKTYFARLCAAMTKHGWDAGKLEKVIWACCGAMVKNDGSMTNEARFWQTFQALTGTRREDVEAGFLEFYEGDFQQIRKVAQQMEESAAVVRLLKQKGYRVAVATNPLFPGVATFSRIRWAGMEPEMFDRVTTYENSCYSKPDRRYYEELLEKLGTVPKRCLMVGNDTAEDMCAAELGMQVYLVTDHLVDREGRGAEEFPHGSLHEFYELVKSTAF